MGQNLTYDGNIPLPGDNPSTSQGEILTNFASIETWTEQDHFGFGTGTDGQHLQLNFPTTTGPFTPALTSSVVYTSPGTASTSTAELFLKNSGTLLLLSAVKAFGIINGSNGTLLNGYNATSVRNGGGNYTATLTNSCVTGSSYSVICSCARAISSGTDQMEITYTISGNSINFITVQQAPFVGAVDVVSMSFVILQL